MVRKSRRFGFAGSSCIPSGAGGGAERGVRAVGDEVALAERIVSQGDRAIAEGRGTFQLDGSMIDGPVIERARRTLARRGGR